MTSQEFKSFWESKYPEAFPIGHEFKSIYDKRWFRIHSLPESKRYADSEKEYQIIFDRQNQVIKDVLGEEEIILLFGLYTNDIMNENYQKIKEFSEFEKVETIELHKLRPEENEEMLHLDIFIKTTNWESNKRNKILKAIANDEIRMMLISEKKNRIINPYDGGLDIILESEEVRNSFKEKYNKWLSNHPEGL